MSFTELKRHLAAEGIDPATYRVNETPVPRHSGDELPASGVHCIMNYEEGVRVFLWRDGCKVDELTFGDRTEAIEHFRTLVAPPPERVSA